MSLLALIGCGVLVAIAVFVRARLLDIPLERDEGEYAYAGQMLLRGLPPYEYIYNMKFPGIYAVYAGILLLFGQTTSGIHLGLLVVNLGTMAILFFLGRRLFDDMAGMTAAAVFGVLSVGESVLGFTANAEHFVLLFACAGLLLLVRGRDRDRLLSVFLGGVLLGTGVIVKQQGAGFLLAGGLFLLPGLRNPDGRPRTVRMLGLLLLGAAVPYLATCLIFLALGIFDRFWFWTVEYARAYADQVPVSKAFSRLKQSAIPIFTSAPLPWTLAAVGLSAMYWNLRARVRSAFLIPLGVCSFLAICPGFYFRLHYFILVLPAAALFAGIGAGALAERFHRGRTPAWSRAGAGFLAIVCLVATLIQQRDFLFTRSPMQISRDVYGLNPFVESPHIGKFIESHTRPDDTIAVIGSEPQLYFYAKRRAATGYIYTYAMMEEHDFALQMQEEMIAEIEAADPEIVVYVEIRWSWLRRKHSAVRILEWLPEFMNRYERVGLIEIRRDQSRYYWGGEIPRTPRTKSWIEVRKRRP